MISLIYMAQILLDGLCFDSLRKRFAMDETGIAASFKFINKLYEFVDKLKTYENKNRDDNKAVKN